MRCMTRNKRLFYYSSFERKDEIIDEYGNHTGQYDVIYSKPIKCSGNVSVSQGETQSRQFGESETYDRVIVLDEINTPIDEYSILWVDSLPDLNNDGSLKMTDDGNIVTPHDYIVKKVARSLNSVALLISKVDIGG